MSEYAISVMGGAAAPIRVEAAPRPALVVGPPPEAGGSDVWWSPDHLLLAAVATSFDTTFRAMAARAGVPIRELVCRARGPVDASAAGLRVKRIHLAVEVEVHVSDSSKANALLAEAERRCLVRSVVSVPVQIESIVTLAAA